MEDEKKDVWDIVVEKQIRERVIFEEPLTQEEAIEAYHNDEYEDISDTEDMSSGSVIRAY